MGLGEMPGTDDPIRGNTRQDLQLLLQIHRGLVGLPSKTGQPLPGLASRWEASPDRTSWRFWLQEEAAFWDGTPVRAEDVKESFFRLLRSQPSSSWQWLLRLVQGGSEGRLEGVVVEDERVVRIDLVRSDPDFLVLLGQPALSVVRIIDGKMMGTGPYALTDVEEGKWKLERCRPGPDGPYLDGIRFLHIPESESRRLEFELGGLDCVFLEVSDYLKLSTDIRWQDSVLIPDKPWKQIFLVLNGRKPFLSAPKARSSLASSLRVMEACDTVLKPLAQRSLSLLPSEVVGLPEKSSTGSFETETLPRMSRPSFGELRLWAPLGSSDSHRLAEKMQSDFMDEGLTVSLVRTVWQEMPARWEKGEYDLALIDSSRWSWLPYTSKEGLIHLERMMHSEFLTNGTSQDMREAETFLRRAWETKDLVHQRRLCIETASLFAEVFHCIPLVSVRTPLAVSMRVHGVRFLDNGLLDLERAWLQEAPQREMKDVEEQSGQDQDAQLQRNGR